jgi:hypothetical protein
MDALLVVPAPMKAMNEERPHRNFKGVWFCAALWTHPLRLGWLPTRLFAQLQKGYPERPDGKGGKAAFDT